ncbi:MULTISPECIES: hypothetical protein [unclassified Microbacterium]|uniref:hypothetical protein n=1 Tax=unclassified Microbacterium TaxID=2609290 RepID=UPI0037457461
MHRIHYAGDSILTGSAIALGLLDYARALAQAGSADTVSIPTLDENCGAGRSEVLVGPSSQLIADEEKSRCEELIDEGLVADLAGKSDRLRRYGTSTPQDALPPIQPGDGWSEFDGI